MEKRENYSPEFRFKTNVLSLCDFIGRIISSFKGKCDIKPEVVSIVSMFLLSADADLIIRTFITSCFFYNDENKVRINLWDKIKRKDESFFFENADHIFSQLPTKEVGAFKGLFTPNEKGETLISAQHKKILWDYFRSFVKISITYIYNSRLQNGNFMQEIPEISADNIPELIRTWEVNILS